MADRRISDVLEEGIVSRFSSAKGYGFIETSKKETLFLYITEVMEIGSERIEPGTAVKFYRGFALDGRVKVAKIVELNGKPAGKGTYKVQNKRFVLISSTLVPEEFAGMSGYVRGRVENFLVDKGYGFAQVEGKTVLFHQGKEGRAVNGAFVPYQTGESRPVPKKGDTVMLWITRGKSGTGGRAMQWVLELSEPKKKDSAPVSNAVQASEVRPRIAAPPPVKQNGSAVVPVEKKIDPLSGEVWIEVDIRKIRQERTAYAESRQCGQIHIPWKVFMQARITSMRRGERFEVKCIPGSERPVATSIRRY